VTQSAMAFSTLVGAFSLIVSQFQSISNFTAVVSRLEALSNAIEQEAPATETVIRIREGGDEVAYEGLTLASPHAGPALLKDLSIAIPWGIRVLVAGPNEAAGVALFKATAGLAVPGAGLIRRPNAEAMLFLAEKPYLPPGTLREVLVPTSRDTDISDDRLTGLLRELNLEAVLTRAGGLHKERDWDSLLSLAEQQLLAFIHVLLRKPRFVFLDRADTALSAEQIRSILGLLSAHSITYITLCQDAKPADLYDAVLDIREDGRWSWQAPQPRHEAALP
jgi:putative ATP-binding cassette transporter